SNSGNIRHPWSVAVDSKNNVYWTDTEFNQVATAGPAGGSANLVAGDGTAGSGGDGGPPQAAQLNLPKGLAIDTAGTVYIGDSGNNKVRSVAANAIKTVAGNGAGGYQGDGGPATSAELNGPTGLALTATADLLIGDTLTVHCARVRARQRRPPQPRRATPRRLRLPQARRPARGTGSWPPTAASSTSEMPSSSGPRAPPR